MGQTSVTIRYNKLINRRIQETVDAIQAAAKAATQKRDGPKDQGQLDYLKAECDKLYTLAIQNETQQIREVCLPKIKSFWHGELELDLRKFTFEKDILYYSSVYNVDVEQRMGVCGLAYAYYRNSWLFRVVDSLAISASQIFTTLAVFAVKRVYKTVAKWPKLSFVGKLGKLYEAKNFRFKVLGVNALWWMSNVFRKIRKHRKFLREVKEYGKAVEAQNGGTIQHQAGEKQIQ